MRRLLVALLACAFLVGTAAGSAASAGGSLEVTPIGRLPFPERGYVVDLPPGHEVANGDVHVSENGRPASGVEVSSLGDAGIQFGAVLALDTSESMTGRPLDAALSAARSFVGHRVSGEQVGLVTFDGKVTVVARPTADGRRLARNLSRTPSVAYGTRIYDALQRSLTLLDAARLSTGSVVLLSDGADIGSSTRIGSIIAAAQQKHVRIFTVGLRSGAFEAGPLRRLAQATGGTFVETTSPAELAAVYTALGQRLGGEYVVRYRSAAAPSAHVHVTIDVGGVGRQTLTYTAPTPAGLPPFHRSLVSRFLLSPASTVVLSFLVVLLTGAVVFLLIRPRPNGIVERVSRFAAPGPVVAEQEPPEAGPAPFRRARAVRGGFMGRLERDLEIARIELPAGRVVLLTAAGTVLAFVVLALVSPVFAVLGLLTPLVPRSLIARKLRQVRDAFADQLAPNLQVLASALRVGHSFVAALTVVVENAAEPSKSELQRVLVDERLGVPPETALRRVAERMASRDLEQVALLAELQRTAGGNAAEVLDTVVETLRERADLRRLVRTLTAQGRLARWILSALPPVAGLMFFALDPTAIRPLVQSGVGQGALVFAALLVVTGSFVIQKIVDIKV